MSDIKGISEGYAILELMGHRKIMGKISECSIYGKSFCRIDVPNRGPTQFFNPNAIFCITPTSKDAIDRMANRKLNLNNRDTASIEGNLTNQEEETF